MILRKILLPLVLLLPFACNELQEEPVVLTEDVLFVSGERVRLSGRIYEDGGKQVTDYGFEVSIESDFTDGQISSLGEKESIGLFFYDVDGLNSEETYYYRAFAIIGNEKVYGQTKSFSTLAISLTSFEPKTAYSGDRLTIIGANFSSNTEVYFGPNRANILSIELETIIEVVVPEGTNITEFIRVKNDNQEATFDEPFEYVYGIWKYVQDFPSDLRFFESISIERENKFLLGMGRNHNGSALNTTMWEYDLNMNSWNELPFIGIPTRGAFYNDGGYFGGGAIDWQFETQPTMGDQFWKYDGTVFSFVGILPFRLYKGVSFYYQGSVFVTGGYKSDGSENFDVYKYDETSGVWTQDEEAPIYVNLDLPSFIYENYAFFLTEEGELWRYDLEIEQWEFVDEVSISVKLGGIVEVIGSKAYIGLYSGDNRIWEYDILTGVWKTKHRFIDEITNIKNSGAFVQNNNIQVVRLNSSGSSNEKMKIWQFDPLAF